MFTIEGKVTTSRCDVNGKLKLFSAVQMMQDCSELWADTEPEMNRYFKEHGMAQVLVSRQIDVVRIPDYKEDLSVESRVFEMQSMCGYRNTFVRDAAGRPCYKSWSMGAFVNRESGHIVPVPADVVATMHLDPKLDMDYCSRRIKLPHGVLSECAHVTVLRDDIDYNMHMNNAQYVRVGCELLPDGFVVKRMRIEYKSPAHLGDVLTAMTGTSGNTFWVTLANGDTTCALMEFVAF